MRVVGENILEEGEIDPREGSGESKSLTFFLSNLPSGVTTEILRSECSCRGQLADVYIARKRDKYGGLFAFARYSKVKNIEKMVKALNTIQIGGKRCFAKVARFGKEDRPTKTPVQAFPSRHLGNSRPNQWKGSTKPIQPALKKSFTEALSGLTSGGVGERVVTLDNAVASHASHWAEVSVVGEAFNISRLCDMAECLKKVRNSRMELRYWGGLKVLITFGSKEEAVKFIEEEKNIWKEWLKEAYIWVGEWLDFERLAWIKIYGVPAALWDARNFIKIGESFGQVVKGLENIIEEGNLVYAHVGVITKSGKRLNEELVVSWGEKKFKCWVSEDAGNWVPGFVEENLTIVTGILGDVGESSENTSTSKKQGFGGSNDELSDPLKNCENDGLSRKEPSPEIIPAMDGDQAGEAEEAVGAEQPPGEIEKEMGGFDCMHGEGAHSAREPTSHDPVSIHSLSSMGGGDCLQNISEPGPAHFVVNGEKNWTKIFLGDGPERNKRKRALSKHHRVGRSSRDRRAFLTPDLNVSDKGGESSRSRSDGGKKKRMRFRKAFKGTKRDFEEVVADSLESMSGGVDDGYESEWGEDSNVLEEERLEHDVCRVPVDGDTVDRDEEAAQTLHVGLKTGISLKGFETELNGVIDEEMAADRLQ